MQQLDADLRALLVCPECRGDLVDVPRGLCCRACGLVYPVVEGVPYMLREEALDATAEERVGEPSP